MDLLCLANLRLPTEKAHGIQIAKMCEAFSDQGVNVTLVSPTRASPIKENLFSFYNLRDNFKFVSIPAADFYFPGFLDRLSFHIKSFLSAKKLSDYARKNNPDVVYSREELSLIFLKKIPSTIVYEAHKFSFLKRPLYGLLLRRKARIIALTEGLKREFTNLGFSERDVIVAPDGVDFNKFAINVSKAEARTKIGLPLDKKIALYSGSTLRWKGLDTFERASKFLPDINFVVVGGNYTGVKENLHYLGYQLHSKIPFYLKSADILVLPNKKDERISRLYTSPMKLFEYMASGRPIVASSLPSIKEVLDHETSVLVKPDDPQALAEGIKIILQNNDLAEKISANAFQKVNNFTWQARVDKIIRFISNENINLI